MGDASARGQQAEPAPPFMPRVRRAPPVPPAPTGPVVRLSLGYFEANLPGSSQEVPRNARNLLFYNRL